MRALSLLPLLVACAGPEPVVLDTDPIEDTDVDPTPALAIPCEDPRDAVWAPIDGLPEATPGQVLRCAPAPGESAAALRERLASLPDVEVRTGFSRVDLAYRTERDPGIPGHGTASLFLPEPPGPGPVPLVVIAHGTVGLADVCAPSRRDHAGMDALLLPWIARGVAVVVPDYAGLGGPGVQGYGDAPDTARSVLDAARAGMAATNPAGLTGEVLVAGHSQGGGAALAAQALQPTYAPELDLTGVVAFAGGLPRTDPTPGWRFPAIRIDGGAGVTRATFAIALQADFANLYGPERRGEPLHPDVREAIVAATDTRCILELTATLAAEGDGYTPPDVLGELVDPDFRLEVVGCVDGGTRCTPRADAYVDRKRAGLLRPDADGARVLLVAGGQDIQYTPGDAACQVEILEDARTPHTVCVDPEATHFDVVDRTVAHALGWAGLGPEVACPDGTLPRCPY